MQIVRKVVGDLHLSRIGKAVSDLPRRSWFLAAREVAKGVKAGLDLRKTKSGLCRKNLQVRPRLVPVGRSFDDRQFEEIDGSIAKNSVASFLSQALSFCA